MDRLNTFSEFLFNLDLAKVPRVILLHGPRGSGKEFYANKLALSLADPLDYLKFYPENYTFSIDRVRKIVSESTKPPRRGSYRVFYITGFPYMSSESSNVLLKALEDNYGAQTRFILTSEHLEDVIDTIRSRAMPFYIPPFSLGRVSYMLETEHKIPSGKALKMAALSEGSLDKITQYLSKGSPKLSSKWGTFLQTLQGSGMSEISEETLYQFRERTNSSLSEWLWFWKGVIKSGTLDSELALDVYTFTKEVLGLSLGPINSKMFSRSVVQSLHLLLHSGSRERRFYLQKWGIID